MREVTSDPADLVASDCPLAALQLDQAGAAALPVIGARFTPSKLFVTPTG
jgi:hypothetical protein